MSIVIALLMLSFTGCRTTMPKVVTINHDSIVFKRTIDTVSTFKQDSVFRFLKGDTVFQKEYHTLYRDRINIKVDSFYIKKEKAVPVQVIKKEVPKWCWWILIINILVIFMLGARYYFKWKKGLLKL